MAGNKSNAEWAKAFKAADTDNSGFLTKAELEAVLRKGNSKIPKSTIDAVFEFFDEPNGDQKISLAEFEAGLKKFLLLLQEMKQHFDHFDKDKSGSLSKAEFKSFLVAADVKLTDAEYEKAAAEADKDKNGQINFEEFLTSIK